MKKRKDRQTLIKLIMHMSTLMQVPKLLQKNYAVLQLKNLAFVMDSFISISWPHLRWSCQVTFGSKDFDNYMSWLDANRKNLTVFIHGVTGDDLKDHTEFSYWLDLEVELNLDVFDNS
jgi:aromatic ring-cleaving dioxygenase